MAFEVADLDVSVRYAREVLGLHEVERVDGVAYLTCNDRHHETIFIQGSQTRVDHVAFEVSDLDAVTGIADRLISLGHDEVLDAWHERGIDGQRRFVGPGGAVFELHAAMDRLAHTRTAEEGLPPRRLEHVTLVVEELEPFERFMVDGLGFIQSDRVAGALSWLRCGDHHHDFNFMGGDHNALHHQAWDVPGLLEIGRLGDLLASRGEKLEWGPGRHGPGHVLFGYFRDVNRVVNEYCADVARISDGYEVREWPNEPSTPNQWGPQPPEGFLRMTTPFRPIA